MPTRYGKQTPVKCTLPDAPYLLIHVHSLATPVSCCTPSWVATFDPELSAEFFVKMRSLDYTQQRPFILTYENFG